MDSESSESVKAWTYVGRFMANFALIESTANEIFGQMLGLNDFGGEAASGKALAHLVLISNVDLRKKLLVSALVLKHLEIDSNQTIKQVHTWHDLRNKIVHSSFCNEVYPKNPDSEPGSDDYVLVEGVSFDYVSSKGAVDDMFIGYEEFDEFASQMSTLWEELESLLGQASLVTVPEQKLKEAIEEAIAASENVIRFPHD